jgi:hypothetical protein
MSEHQKLAETIPADSRSLRGSGDDLGGLPAEANAAFRRCGYRGGHAREPGFRRS